jgi:LPXTG-motif cell wall-anchored protein
MLIDKKILAGGIAMLIVGIIIMINLNANMPVGKSGMTEEEIIDLMTKQQENQDMTTLAGILIGIGFLLILISFGSRKRRKKPIT